MNGTARGLLYICYQSIHEPLTHTQVVAYLRGLAFSHPVWLLTFEPTALSRDSELATRRQLLEQGIHWTWLRYHKRPSALATAFDVIAGAWLGGRLVQQHGLRWVHARSHVPAAMALLIERMTDTRFVFDIRGFLAEEYVDAGVWSAHSLLPALVKRVERDAVQKAAGLIVLTKRAEQMLREWYPQECAGKPVAVIPTCVPVQQFAIERTPRSQPLRFIYAGKLGGWYWTEALADFFRAARAEFSNAQLTIVTQSDPALLDQLTASFPPGAVDVHCVRPAEMPAMLSQADIALCFIKPSLSKQASSPTKIGEYLAAGLPVVVNAGIGELDALFPPGCGIGVLVPSHSEQSYRAAARAALGLVGDPRTVERCRAVARAQFDLLQVGWPRYCELYQELSR